MKLDLTVATPSGISLHFVGEGEPDAVLYALYLWYRQEVPAAALTSPTVAASTGPDVCTEGRRRHLYGQTFPYACVHCGERPTGRRLAGLKSHRNRSPFQRAAAG